MSTLPQNDPSEQSKQNGCRLAKVLLMHCQCKYPPEPKPQGYPENLRKQAAEKYVDGMNLRKIARH